MDIEHIVHIDTFIEHCGKCKESEFKNQELVKVKNTVDTKYLYCPICRTLYVFGSGK